jgi:hypothetical protein
MRLLHSEIDIFIFDPNRGIIRAILMQCALCANVLRISVKQNNAYFGNEKNAVSWDYD